MHQPLSVLLLAAALAVAASATSTAASRVPLQTLPLRTHQHRHREGAPALQDDLLLVPISNPELAWVLQPRDRQQPPPRGCRQTSATVHLYPLTALHRPAGPTQHFPIASETQNLHLPAQLKPDHLYAWAVTVNATCLGSPPSTQLPTSARIYFRTQPAAFPSSAVWIGGFNRLSTSITLAKPVARATAYCSGLGSFYLYLNGEQVGDHVMDPGQGVYPTRVKYLGFELANNTALRPPGTPNTLVATIGNYKWGYLDVWCNITAAGGPDGCRAFIFALQIEYTDGSTETHVSSPDTWRGQHGPIILDNVYNGEIVDNRRAQALRQAEQGGRLVGEPPVQMHPVVGLLVPEQIEPIRVVDTIAPQQVVKFDTGCPASAHVLGGVVLEGDSLTLRCAAGSGSIQDIAFASFGTPAGNCPNYQRSAACDAPAALDTVKKLCLGKSACTIPASNAVFGGDPCPDTLKSLAVVASGCAPDPSAPGSRNVSWVLDFGTNMAGVTRLQVQGVPANTTIVIRHGETRAANGHVQNQFYSDSMDCSMAAWYANSWAECANMSNAFITAGSDGLEVYTPSFMYAGFRFAEVFGLPPDYAFDEAQTLLALRQQTDLTPAGHVRMPVLPSTSGNTSDILNRVHQAVVNAQSSQLWSLPTDCPTREKRGWMGDAHMSSSELAFNYDCRQFHRSFLQSIRDDQLRGCQHNPLTDRDSPCSNPAQMNGSVPDVTPYTTGPYGSNPGSPVWQSAFPVIAHNLWRHYADTSTLAALFDGLREFIDYLERNADAQSGLPLFGGLGDWVPPGGNSKQPTPTDSVTAFYWLYDLLLMEEVATALARPADAARFAALRANGTRAYHAKFFNSSAVGYGRGSQCSNMMALQMDTAPNEAVEQQVLAALLADIQRHSQHLNLGIVGTTFIFDVLARFNHSGLALDLLLDDSYPSFGYMVAQNATTLWEAWEGTVHDPVSSRNHIMFGGGVGTFVYTAIGGLDTVCNGSSAGWRHVRMGPAAAVAARLGGAQAYHLSNYGNNTIAWQGGETGAFSVQVGVPAGVSATVKVVMLGGATRVRAGNAASGPVVWEKGAFKPGAEAGVVGGVGRTEEGHSVVILEVLSGDYVFYAVGDGSDGEEGAARIGLGGARPVQGLTAAPVPCNCPNATLCKPIDVPPRPEILAFHPGGAQLWHNYDFRLVTTIAVFGEVDPDLVCYAHAHNVRVVVGAGMAQDQLNNATARAAYVQQMAQAAAVQGLDGINIDIEGAGAATRDGLTALMAELRAAYPPPRQVTMDISINAPGSMPGYDYPKLISSVDFMVPMAYDMCWGSHTAIGNSPLPATKAHVQQYMTSTYNVSADKIVLGLPWYGYRFPCDSAPGPGVGQCTTTQPFGGGSWQVGYGWAQDTLRSTGAALQYDAGSVSEFYTYNETIQTTAGAPKFYQIWFDSPRTLAQKYQMAASLQLRGVAFWHADTPDYAQDPAHAAAMWNTLRNFTSMAHIGSV